jgi:hypothetical protein
MENLVTATGEERNIFIFQMAISVAYEIIHLLTGFLSGRREPNTPPEIAAVGYVGDGDDGEAGRFWEIEALGGIVEFFADPENPDGPNQAGVPYLFRDLSSGSPVGPIGMDYIQGFAASGGEFAVLSNKYPSL